MGIDAMYCVLYQYISEVLLDEPFSPLWYGDMHEMILEKAAAWLRTVYQFLNLSEPFRTKFYDLRSKFQTKFGNNATAFELMVYLQDGRH